MFDSENFKRCKSKFLNFDLKAIFFLTGMAKKKQKYFNLRSY